MERRDFATMVPGTNLWVESTGERVTFRYLTHLGARCAGLGTDATHAFDDLLEAPLRNRTKSRTRAHFERREAAPQPPSAAQTAALAILASGPDVEVWYHDIGARTADALLARGWIAEVGRVRCLAKNHNHPGVVAITAEGSSAHLTGDWLESEGV